MSWFEIQNNFITLKIKVKTNKKETKIISIDDNFIAIDLHAQPIDGEANKELIQYISEYFKTPKSSLDFIRGQKSKIKVIQFETNEYALNAIEKLNLVKY